MAPRRKLTAGRAPRWTDNLGIVAIDIVAVRLLIPLLWSEWPWWRAGRGWGLFPHVGLPYWAAVVVGVVALDLVIYVKHVVFHHAPWLRRLHRMHHADVDIDVTTGVRFHPLKILLSLAMHHSAERAETDSNYCFNLPWWDRLLGTYRAEPKAGEKNMVIGLPDFRDAKELRITRLLTQPCRNDKDRQAPKKATR